MGASGGEPAAPPHAPEKTGASSDAGLRTGCLRGRTGFPNPREPALRLSLDPLSLLALPPLLSSPSITGDGRGPPHPSKLLPLALLTELKDRADAHAAERCAADKEVDDDEEEEEDEEEEDEEAQLPTLDEGEGPGRPTEPRLLLPDINLPLLAMCAVAQCGHGPGPTRNAAGPLFAPALLPGRTPRPRCPRVCFRSALLARGGGGSAFGDGSFQLR